MTRASETVTGRPLPACGDEATARARRAQRAVGASTQVLMGFPRVTAATPDIGIHHRVTSLSSDHPTPTLSIQTAIHGWQRRS